MCEKLPAYWRKLLGKDPPKELGVLLEWLFAGQGLYFYIHSDTLRSPFPRRELLLRALNRILERLYIFLAPLAGAGSVVHRD
jgi:hypothetical protein